MTGVVDAQELCGLRLAADFALGQDRPVPLEGPLDVSVTSLPVTPGRDGPLAGRPLLDASLDQTYYQAAEAADGSRTLRFRRTGEFVVSADLSRATFQPFEGSVPGMAAVMTTGALLAFQLYLRGSLVLHASAVDVGGRAVAFVGASGMGKSTMATLLCAEGAGIVTDDVLRVEVEDGWPTVRLGATDVRLRKGADALAERFGSRPERRRSADDRQLLRPRAGADHLPLAALVIPAPDRTHDSVRLQRLTGPQALFAVLRFPRLLGWQDEAVHRRLFSQTARLVEQVPVCVAHVPWGPPFQPDTGARLLAALATTAVAAHP